MKSEEILSKFPPRFSVKDVVAAKKWLVRPDVRGSIYNGVFASFKDGKLFKEVLTGACHGSLPTMAPSSVLMASSTKGVSSSKSYQPIAKEEPEIAKLWFDYLLNGNYFSPFYVHTTAENAAEAGFLVPTTLPANLLLGCLIQVRHAHEKKEFLRFWGELVAKGVDKDVAYLMVFGLGLASYPGSGTTQLYFQSPGHNAITFATPTMIKGWLNRDYNNLLLSYADRKEYKGNYAEYYGYGQSSVIPYPKGGSLGTAGLRRYRDALADFFATVGKSESKSIIKPIASPFAKKHSTLSSLSTPTGNPYPLLETILKFAKEFETFLTTEYLNV